MILSDHLQNIGLGAYPDPDSLGIPVDESFYPIIPDESNIEPSPKGSYYMDDKNRRVWVFNARSQASGAYKSASGGIYGGESYLPKTHGSLLLPGGYSVAHGNNKMVLGGDSPQVPPISGRMGLFEVGIKIVKWQPNIPQGMVLLTTCRRESGVAPFVSPTDVRFRVVLSDQRAILFQKVIGVEGKEKVLAEAKTKNYFFKQGDKFKLSLGWNPLKIFVNSQLIARDETESLAPATFYTEGGKQAFVFTGSGVHQVAISDARVFEEYTFPTEYVSFEDVIAAYLAAQGENLGFWDHLKKYAIPMAGLIGGALTGGTLGIAMVSGGALSSLQPVQDQANKILGSSSDAVSKIPNADKLGISELSEELNTEIQSTIQEVRSTGADLVNVEKYYPKHPKVKSVNNVQDLEILPDEQHYVDENGILQKGKDPRLEGKTLLTKKNAFISLGIILGSYFLVKRK